MDMLHLINLVRSYRNLWDKKCREYCNREINKATWTLIGEELNVSADLCKSKWCNLRDTFRKEYNKTLEYREGGTQTPSKWKFYNEMLFLLDQLGPPREIANNIGYVGYIEVKSENQDDQSSDKEPLQMTASHDYDIDNEQRVIEQSSPMTFARKSLPVKHKRKCNTMRINESIEQKLLKMKKTKLEMYRDNVNDSDRMFLLSLLPYLKKFSDEKKLFVRHKIQGVILEELSIESNQRRNEMIINLHPSQFSPPTMDAHSSTHTPATTNFSDQQDNSEIYSTSNNLHRESSNFFENPPLTNIKFENSISLLDSK